MIPHPVIDSFDYFLLVEHFNICIHGLYICIQRLSLLAIYGQINRKTSKLSCINSIYNDITIFPGINIHNRYHYPSTESRRDKELHTKCMGVTQPKEIYIVYNLILRRYRRK